MFSSTGQNLAPGCQHAPASSQMQLALCGEPHGRATAAWPVTVWQQEIQGDRSLLAFPCYPFSAINCSCKLPIRLWRVRALIGKVTFLSIWQYWCLPFLFSGVQSFMPFIISSIEAITAAGLSWHLFSKITIIILDLFFFFLVLLQAHLAAYLLHYCSMKIAQIIIMSCYMERLKFYCKSEEVFFHLFVTWTNCKCKMGSGSPFIPGQKVQ